MNQQNFAIMFDMCTKIQIRLYQTHCLRLATNVQLYLTGIIVRVWPTSEVSRHKTVKLPAKLSHGQLESHLGLLSTMQVTHWHRLKFPSPVSLTSYDSKWQCFHVEC